MTADIQRRQSLRRLHELYCDVLDTLGKPAGPMWIRAHMQEAKRSLPELEKTWELEKRGLAQAPLFVPLEPGEVVDH